MTTLSVLDLAPIVDGSNAAEALANSIALARHAEALGYRRFWVAEHHNMDGIASSATAVVIGQLAAATQSIRVGSGGIMLPNHAPLVIAEQFGTLATFFPGRIDLGLGRAPGTDGPTMRALRRHLSSATEDRFPEDVIELQSYLAPEREGQAVRAVPGQGTEVPIWLLGSSLYSAQLAAYLGLPFAFASHFAPEQLMQALELYRDQYRPSAKHPTPYAMMGINIIVADTDEEAAYLFTSLQQRFLGMQRGKRGLLPRPVDSMAGLWSAQEQAGVERMLAESLVGSPATVAAGLRATQTRTGVDEFIVACAVHDARARLRSYELLADLAGSSLISSLKT
ncbi:MAG: LLM class flavin-dependent oxidoreductase [Paucibacter sp.]|nr:LLM class flavin-dependent oxidoreductase [Roseateles sp.]